mmetsp:Transcript_115552/g.299557  ORF Transcript_115552/g.299557 Transcript_115552/m.299557 type:complete len:203 (-) Transcript_115552:163-771(-)
MHLDRENGVRPGAHRVHHRRRHRAVVDAALQEVLQLLRVLRHDLREVLHVDAHHRMLLDLQTATKLALVRDRIQQVEDDLVVDLEVRAHDQKSLRAHLLDLDLLEERLVHPRGDAAELWGVRGTRHAPALAAPRLPVGEDRAVVALEGLGQSLPPDGVVDLVLLDPQAEDDVKGELRRLLLACGVCQNDLTRALLLLRERLC